MGYVLSHVGQVSVGPEMEFYFYLVGTPWTDGVAESVRSNFVRLSTELGPSSAIVIPTDRVETEHWGQQISEAYFEQHEVDKMTRSVFERIIPLLFIADASPDNVRQDTLRVLIPLEDVQKRYGNIDGLFNDLVRLAKNRDIAIFNRFQETADWSETFHDLVILKPQVFGMGVNINAAIKRLRAFWKSDSE